MNKLEVNLLPTDILQEKQHAVRFSLLKKISFGILILTVVSALIVLALHFEQQSAFNQANKSLSTTQNNLMALSEKEAQAWLIKDRLSSIESILGTDSKRKQVFNMIVDILPSSMTLSDLTLDKANSLGISVSTNSLTEMDNLFNDLANPNRNQNLITKVDFDGLTLGQSGSYRFSLKIITK